MNNFNKTIIISGATATGKTGLSFKIAKILLKQNIETAIVNFDSLLFYKELNIGTAKPTTEEIETIPHHLVNISSAKYPINAADFTNEAKKTIEMLHSKKIIPILVGGSAFYLRALIKGMYETKPTDSNIKSKIDIEYKQNGIDPFWKELQQNDPVSAKNLHKNDHYRILRAIEFMRTTGEPISRERERLDNLDPYDFENNNDVSWEMLHLYLEIPKEEHLKIIDKRTKKMISDGLIDEVEKLVGLGIDENFKPMQSIGYKETIDFLKNNIKSQEELIDRINISTRQLAKSQKTFFKKIKGKTNLNPLTTKAQDLEELINYFTKIN